MSKIRALAIGSVILGLAAIAVIIYHVGFLEIFSIVTQASPVFLTCYILTSILIAVILTFKWKLILHANKITIPFHRLFSYRLVGYSVSYLTPTAHVGGEPIRAFLLKREGVHINKAFSTVIIDKSIEIMADILFFFFGALLILNSVAVKNSTKLVLLCFSLMLILLAGMFIGGVLGKQSMFVQIFRFFRLHQWRRLRNVENNLKQIEKDIEMFYRTKKEHFILIVFMMMLLWALMFFEYRFALLMFGEIASPLQIFLILTGVGLAYSLPVPAAMGTLELGQLSAAKVINLSSATGIALAFLVRTRDLVWTALGLILLSFYRFDFQTLARKTKEIDKSFEQGDLYQEKS